MLAALLEKKSSMARVEPEGPEAEDEFENGDLGGDASGAGGVGGGVGGGGGGERGARSGKSLFQTLSRKKSMINELGGGQVRKRLNLKINAVNAFAGKGTSKYIYIIFMREYVFTKILT